MRFAVPALGASCLSVIFLAGCGGGGDSSEDVITAPKGLEKFSFHGIDMKEFTADRVALGKQLFFDKRLSKNEDMACHTCHKHELGWTDGQQFSTKSNGKKNTRNSPTLYNVGFQPHYYWDGRKDTLEGNILAAWKGHMDGNPEEAAKKLTAIAGYDSQFKKCFNESATGDHIVTALAMFVRSLRAGNTAWDNKDKQPLGPSSTRGEKIYMQRCVSCHTMPLFTSFAFHNAGIGFGKDPGRGKIETDRPETEGAFKVPTLRNVTKTGPYFHDGSVEKLEEAVKIMAHGGIDNPKLDPILKANASLPKLDERQLGDLMAFLKTLESNEKFTPPVLP